VKLALEVLGERAAGVVLNDVDTVTLPHGRWLYADDPRDAAAVPPGSGRQAG